MEHDPLWLLGSLEHGQLMAQCDDLGLHSSLAAKPDEKGIEQHYKVEHGQRMLTAQTCNFNSSKADEADGVFSKDRRYAVIKKAGEPSHAASQVRKSESVGPKQSSGKKQNGGDRLTAAGRKKLSDLMKKRWADKRKGKTK
jgi:hypothetical protein